MSGYELTESAAGDLREIARYTVSTWGIEQARRYEALIEAHFQSLSGGNARTRVFLEHRPELVVSRVEHHYVFHLIREKRRPLILAVLHENMDLMNRLRDRLDT